MKGYVWHIQITKPNRQKFVYENMESLEYALRVFKLNSPSMQEWKASSVGAPQVQDDGFFRVEMWYGKKEEQKAKQENSKEENGGVGLAFNAWQKEH